MRRPGEVFREQSRLVALGQRLEPRQVRAVEGAGRADGEPDPVQRERIALADGRQVVMRATARPHVVLGMDLEEAEIGSAGQNGVVVLALQTDAGTRRNAGRHLAVRLPV